MNPSPEDGTTLRCNGFDLVNSELPSGSAAFDLGLDAAQRLRRVDVDQRRRAGRPAPRPPPRCSGRSDGARRRRPRSPSDRGRTAATTAPDCRACRRMVGTTTSAPLLRIEGGDQPVDQRRVDLRHVAEADDRAVGVGRHRGDAGLERGRQARRRSRDCGRAAPAARRAPPRPARADGRSPRSPARRARPAPARRRCAPAAGRRSRPAACSARPCGSSGRRRARWRRCAAPVSATGSSRGCGRVTISISRPPTPSR